MEPPPESVIINSTEYPINWDFAFWIEISGLIEEMDTQNLEYTGENTEAFAGNLDLVEKIEMQAFSCVLPEDIGDVLEAVFDFWRGYPSYMRGSDDKPEVFSFQHDLNFILLAIRNQSGIDLSYRRDRSFHWWEFLLEFQSLTSDHYISQLMELRSYDGDDKQMQKARSKVALPAKLTAAGQKTLDEMEAVFYG